MKITDHAEHAEQQQNSFVKEEVKKKKKKCVHLEIMNLHSFASLVTK